MSWLGHSPELESPKVAEDRRCDDRTKVLKHIRVVHVDSLGKETEQAGTLMDLSRDGLLFASPFHGYRVGMELRFVFPETAAECSGEVVRAEPLPNGHIAVGVRILGW